MGMSTMTIVGLYNFDSTIFDNMLIPESVDRDILVNKILMDCSELEFLYPDAEAAKLLIGFWSKATLPVWEKLAKTLEYDYDPLTTYDMYEDRDETEEYSGTERAQEDITRADAGERKYERDTSDSATYGGSSSSNTTGANTSETTSEEEEVTSNTKNTTANGTNLTEVAAYNASALVDSSKVTSESTGTEQDNGTDTTSTTTNTTGNTQQNVSGTYSDTSSSTGSDERTETENLTRTTDRDETITETSETGKTRKTHSYGNVGAMSFQDLVKAEREVSEFNIYTRIATDFRHRFCILVW